MEVSVRLVLYLSHTYIFLSCTSSVTPKISSQQWLKLLDEKPGSILAGNPRSGSITKCAVSCFRSGSCRGFFVGGLGNCIAASAGKVALNLVLSGKYVFFGVPGPTRHGDSCRGDTDCAVVVTRCVSGRCACMSGYSYALAQDRCVTHCNRGYDNDFALQSLDFCVSYRNKKSIKDIVSAEKCRRLCVNAGFLCKTFELFHGNCYLQEVSRLDVATHEWKAWGTCHYFQRNCAVIKTVT